MNENKPLPKGWEVKKLEEIKTIEFLRGNGLPKSALNDSGKSECIHYGQLYTTYKHPVIKKVVFRANIEGKRLSNKGDVLIPGTTTADAMGIAIARSLNVNNVVIGGDINILRTKNMDIFSDFLSYYLNGPAKVELASYANGTNILHLSNKKIKKILIPIPSLSEQKRIVAILDKTFAEITKAEAIAKTNLQNAKELFESYLNNVFENKGDDWVEKKLGDICKNLDSKRIPITKNKRIEGDIPYYGASGIVDYVNEYIFNEDLLLVSEDGANLLARTYPIAFSISGKTWVNNHAHVLRFQSIVAQRFTEYYLNSIRLDDYVSGMAQPKLNQRMLNSILVPDADKYIQKNVVGRLDKLKEQTQSLESKYQQELSSLEELKKSILQKAFNGEL